MTLSDTRGLIYFMRCGNFVKIGFLRWSEERLRFIQTGNPFPIQIIAAYPGTYAQERAIQAHFLRLQHQGEWFNVDDELQSVIDNGFSRISAPLPLPRPVLGSMAETLCKFAVDAANEFCRATGYKLSTISIRATGNANFFEHMAIKKQGSFKTWDKAIQYLRNNWPEGAIWPSTPPWPYRRPAQGVTNGKTERFEEQGQARQTPQARKGGRARHRA